MTDEIDLTTPGAWVPSESLTLLRHVMSLQSGVRQHVAEATGLSETEVHALEHLARQPIGPAEIARLLDVSTAASTGIVDRLAAKGHVERRPHSSDRRRTEVVLTPSAWSEVVSHMGGMFQALARLDATLDPGEREIVVRYLRGAVAAVESISAPRATAGDGDVTRSARGDASGDGSADDDHTGGGAASGDAASEDVRGRGTGPTGPHPG